MCFFLQQLCRGICYKVDSVESGWSCQIRPIRSGRTQRTLPAERSRGAAFELLQDSCCSVVLQRRQAAAAPWPRCHAQGPRIGASGSGHLLGHFSLFGERSWVEFLLRFRSNERPKTSSHSQTFTSNPSNFTRFFLQVCSFVEQSCLPWPQTKGKRSYMRVQAGYFKS